MIVSHKQRFVLLAPWKTASSTAHRRLMAYNDNPYSRFYDYNPFLQRVVHQHITYSEFVALPESRLNYFVGAFVRNPYDRVYSGFLQLQRDIQRQPSAMFPTAWIKALVMHQLDENFAQLAAGEFDFDKWFKSVKEQQIYDIGRNTSFPLHPAHYWTGINGQQKIDFVGRVEEFENDFDAFCRNVGIEPTKRENENVSADLPDAQAGHAYRYVNRMTSESVSKINTLFDVDFNLFGYQKVFR